MRMNTIPVTILTGFLGAGKTSLLKRLLADPRFSDTAVVINEFGEVGLDHMLVEAAPEAIVEMTSGCLCCTVRGDVRRTLLMLMERSERGEIPLFSRLVIETTGLADPAPVIHTLLLDPRLARRYRLAQVVTVVDAVNGPATLDRQPEALKQAAVADRLLVTKTDLLKPGEVDAVFERLRAVNPGAVLANTASAEFDLRSIVDDTLTFRPDMKPETVRQWLAAEAVEEGHAHHGHGHHHGHAHDHDHHHHHDVTRHSEDIRSFSLIIEQPISRMAFAMAMQLLTANQGEDLLRVKGIVKLAEDPERPVVIHGVQHILHDPVYLDAWPDDDHRTRLVFITRNIPKETIDGFFRAWAQASVPGDG